MKSHNVGRGVLPLPLGEAVPKIADTLVEKEDSPVASKPLQDTAAAVAVKPLPSTRRAVMEELTILTSHKDIKVPLA